MNEYQRLAIVNRGEAAMRVMHAVADHNSEADAPITTIALYTDPDAEAWFVREADEAVSLGPATFKDADGRRRHAYLDYDRIFAALAEARADAVWVGWGFVADHADFAERCEHKGITFVGPDSTVIRRLGDKVTSKQIAEKADVPVVPWSGGPVGDLDSARQAADDIGYPVMIKAAAGGGGRGMRRVAGPEALESALRSAGAEAENGFGDPTLFLERVVSGGRHVEVQIIADHHGTTWAAGLRDCSLQRRNQKVVEESACTVLDAATEREIKDAAVRLCETAGYRNAGTVEFLYEPDSGRYYFMEVNTRLQVEHPVTELTTGLDLVKLQLRVARGDRLPADAPPEGRGHAIEARLNAEDPELDFAAAPGRVVYWRPPTGPGVRVETGIAEGDHIPPEFDSMIAKVLAWGHDRDEALARLRRALSQTVVIVEGGTTNKAFLLGLLDRPEVREGRVHTAWLDALTASGDHLHEHQGLSLLYAATQAYEADRAADQLQFLATASRGRPEAPRTGGHQVDLRFGSASYRCTVYRLGEQTYRVDVAGHPVDLSVHPLGPYENRVRVQGTIHQVIAHVRGPLFQVEVDGAPHRILRDDGGVVRASAPALVIAVAAQPGDEVAAGDPLVVLESMKMETTVAAPFPGRVQSIDVTANEQVMGGAPLVHLQPTAEAGTTVADDAQIDFSAQYPSPPAASDGTARITQFFDALRSYQLGYDLDPATIEALATEQSALHASVDAEDPELLAREEEVLDLFADLGALSRRRPEYLDEHEGEPVASAQEYLFTYLAWLDAERSGVPERFLERLERALRHYGVTSLARSPELEQALFWMYRSFVRVEDITSLVTEILRRRLDAFPALASSASEHQRALLDRVIAGAEGRHQVVSDLAREVRFKAFDEPVMESTREQVFAEMDELLDRLEREPDHPDRSEWIDELVSCRQPLRARLRDRYARGGPALRRVILETNLWRFYRMRELRDVRSLEVDGHLLGVAEYESRGKDFHVVTAFAEHERLPELLGAVGTHLGGVGSSLAPIVGLSLWRGGQRVPGDEMAEMLRGQLDAHWDGPAPHRVDLTMTGGGERPEHERTQQFTFRHSDGSFAEDLLYRNLHPMVAKRLELWRFANFSVSRLPSVEDVYLFHGVARDNPQDERFFATAEVPDLTPVLDEGGKVVSLPHFERMVLQAFTAIRRAQLQRPMRRRLLLNRVILYVRPPCLIPPEAWRDLAHRLASASIGVGLEKVVIRAWIPDPETGELEDSVLHVENLAAHGVTVRRKPAGDQPIRQLSDYRQKVLKSHRLGVPYPYEILRMLAPAEGTASDFPSGTFVEHDLVAHDENELVPVERPPGHNTAGVVVGVISNTTDKVPEGMRRVAILGDPTRSLGSLTEAECRRVIGALDLAQRLDLPVEWFAVSSGARIAMDSGTENMDWIGAVLRRLIEFTQDGREVNVIVTGVNVGAQPYWNAEATMLPHTKGILVMTPDSAMVLTGKQALDFSGGVSAEDNFGIGGYERVMGGNAQAQYWAPDLQGACDILLRHYDHSYIVPGEAYPRRARTDDPVDRDVRDYPHAAVDGTDFTRVGDVFSAERNPERKKPFDIRSVMQATCDYDHAPLERWKRWHDAHTTVVWDAHVGGYPVCMLGIESRTTARKGFVPADGPPSWTSGTLFPQGSKKVARALNAASGNRPVVMLANLSGFDGSPESMRKLQLEYGAEIGRAVTNFAGPIVFVVVSRYHGGAFVVFSKTLNENLEIAAIEGSYASVIGGAPAAGVVFAREVRARTDQDPRVVAAREQLAVHGQSSEARARHEEAIEAVRVDKLRELAAEFDRVHSIERALEMGSVDRIIPAPELRPYVVDALERGMRRAST